MPRIPAESVFEDWLEYNRSADDVYVIVPNGWVRRKVNGSDGKTYCYFNGSDGSLYNYGEC